MSTNDIPPDLPDVISFYDRYVTLCERLGIEPVAAGRAAELIEQWGAMAVRRRIVGSDAALGRCRYAANHGDVLVAHGNWMR